MVPAERRAHLAVPASPPARDAGAAGASGRLERKPPWNPPCPRCPGGCRTRRRRSFPGSASSSAIPPAPFRRGRAWWTGRRPPPHPRRPSGSARSPRGTNYRKALVLPALRERIAARPAAGNGVDPDRFSLMATAGGNMACLTVLLASGDRGEVQDAAGLPQSRAMLPVFGGISGRYGTTWNMALDPNDRRRLAVELCGLPFDALPVLRPGCAGFGETPGGRGQPPGPARRAGLPRLPGSATARCRRREAG